MKKIFFITLFILLTVSGFSQSSSLWSLTYNMSFPMNDTKDFISKSSFRGIGVDGRGYVTDYLTVGGSISWNVFYEKIDKLTVTEENITLTGTQYRYINTCPIFVNTHYYYGNGDKITPYAGIGVGTYYVYQRQDVGLYAFSDKSWHFGLNPEIGVMIPTGGGVSIMVNVKYNYGFKTKNYDPISYFGINVGLAWIN